jgi:hypothetical protein
MNGALRGEPKVGQQNAEFARNHLSFQQGRPAPCMPGGQ